MDRGLILESSFDLINKNGIENFSMRKLAAVLNCRPSTLYHYFSDKNELLNGVYVFVLEQLSFSISSIVVDLEMAIYQLYIHLYEKQEFLLFYKRYHKSDFIGSESNELDVKQRLCRENEFKQFLEMSSLSSACIYLMIMGPINELICNPTMDDANIKTIAGLVAKSLNGGCDE